ncbi:MAG TPA: MMPL family transporter [Streptosporangiaceae bacterium]|jgi:RND superfamily putative drug exporter
MTAQSWGQYIARHRRAVFVIWGVLLIASLAATPYLTSKLGAPDYGVPGSQSAQVTTMLQEHFNGSGSEQDLVVFQARSGTITDADSRAGIAKVLAAVRRSSDVAGVVGPFDPGARQQVARDGRAAFALVGLKGDTSQLAKNAASVQTTVQGTAGPAVQAWLTGYSPITNDLNVVENNDSERAESIGLPVAFVVLLLALGSLVAALLPLLLAICALVFTFGVLTLLTFGIHADSFLVAIVTMIGIGIGIDYSLFIVSRFREEMTRRGVAGLDGPQRAEAVAQSAGRALATSGRTVASSGAILGISMCSLLIVNSPVFQEISWGVLAAVVCTLAAAWTLLPATLAWLGPRVNKGSLPRRFQPAEVRTDLPAGSGGWARMAHAVMRRPILACVLVGGIMVFFALPLGSLHYGIDLGTSSLTGRPSAQAQQVLDNSFGPGLVSPVQVVITGPGGAPLDPAGQQAARAFATALGRVPQLSSVQSQAQDGRVLLNAVPSVPVDSTAALHLVSYIRDDLSPQAESGGGHVQVLVGGTTAEFVDISNEMNSKIPYVLIIVLALTVVFLLFVFRSLFLPFKAVVMNLLSTSAAVGITVAIFQWGYGHKLLGFTSVGYLQVYIPITVFVMLFGLSMDYEVFLIRRMQEVWQSTHDNRQAVAAGIEHTARPIAAAAAIMIVVFGSFVTANVLELKQFGLALAVAVLLDASLVRLVLVPALMRLLGHWNWWLPGAHPAVLSAADGPGETAPQSRSAARR